MRDLFIVLGLVLAFCVGIFLLNYGSLASYSFFAPKYEAVRREVFFNTPSYQLGKEQEQRKLDREMRRNIENRDVLENIKDYLK